MKEGHNIFFDEKVQRFQNKADKYFAHLLGGSKSFLLLFVYEHAHLTANYRGRDLASLRHRRVGKANSHTDIFYCQFTAEGWINV